MDPASQIAWLKKEIEQGNVEKKTLKEISLHFSRYVDLPSFYSIHFHFMLKIVKKTKEIKPDVAIRFLKQCIQRYNEKAFKLIQYLDCGECEDQALSVLQLFQDVPLIREATKTGCLPPPHPDDDIETELHSQKINDLEMQIKKLQAENKNLNQKLKDFEDEEGDIELDMPHYLDLANEVAEKFDIYGACASKSIIILNEIISKNPSLVNQRIKGLKPIHIAASSGFAEGVELLIQNGADINSKSDSDGYYPIHYAAISSSYNTFNILISNGARLDAKAGGVNLTILMAAAQGGNIDILNFVISKGAVIDEKNKMGATALFYAVKSGSLQCVKALLKAGADILAKKFNNDNIMCEAARAGNIDIIMELMKNKRIDINTVGANNETPLLAAIKCKKATIAKHLIEAGADPNAGKALHHAAASGLDEIVTILCEKGLDPNSLNKDGLSPIFMAAERNRKSTIELLIKLGADPDLRKKADGWSALHSAALHCSVDSVKVLLKNVNPNTAAKDGWTALHAAVHGGSIECVKALIDAGANVNAKKINDAFSVLHMAAASGNADIVKLLLSKGADPRYSMPHGWTPLNAAINMGHVKAAEVLIDGGADVNACSPLCNAASFGSLECVKLLFSRGADPHQMDAYMTTPILTAVLKGNTDLIHELVAGGVDINQGNKDGWTPLHAATGISANMVKQLLNEGADPNVAANNGFTALHYGSEKPFSDIVEFLLEAHADPNRQSKDGKTPLYMAVSSWKNENARLLLKAGADPNIKKGSWSVLHQAAVTGNANIIPDLVKAGADLNALNNGLTPLEYAAKSNHFKASNELMKHGATSQKAAELTTKAEIKALFKTK